MIYNTLFYSYLHNGGPARQIRENNTLKIAFLAATCNIYIIYMLHTFDTYMILQHTCLFVIWSGSTLIVIHD